MSICAALGPHDGYVLITPFSNRLKRVPSPVIHLLTRVRKHQRPRAVHEMALGPDGSWAVVYTTIGGKQLFGYENLPDGLRDWLMPNGFVIRDMTRLQISLGPNAAYFAFDGTSSVRGHLPPLLEAYIVHHCLDVFGHWREGYFPQSVSFGPDGAYVFTLQNGLCDWDLRGQNYYLDNILRAQPSLRGIMIVLSPTLPGRYLTWNAWGHCTADPAFEDTRAFRKFARHSKRAMQPQLRGLASANFGSGSSGGNGVVTQLVQGFGSLFGNVLTSALSSTTSGSNIYGVPSTGLDTSFIWAPLLSLITGAIN